MEEREEKIWLEKAKADLSTAKYNFDGKKFDAAGFFSQQSAEKALKAVFIKRFRKLIKVHDLVFIARKLNASQELIDKCKELSPAYLYTRYPDAIPVKNIDSITENLIFYAEEILKWAEESI